MTRGIGDWQRRQGAYFWVKHRWAIPQIERMIRRANCQTEVESACRIKFDWGWGRDI